MRGWNFPLLIAALTVALYLPSLSGGAVFDDHHLLEYHPRLMNLTLHDAFATDFWGGNPTPWKSMHYRPLALLAYRAMYLLFGMDPAAFHLVNVLLNAAAAFLLWIFLEGAGFSRRVTAIAVCLFAVNPLHVEAAAWITGMMETLMAALCLASLACYGRGHRIASVLLAAAAMLEKESAFVLPGIVFLLEWRRARIEDSPKALRRAELAALPYVVPVIACLAARAIILPRMPEDLQARFLDGVPLMAAVGAAYLRMLVWPWPLGISYALPGAGAIALAILAVIAGAAVLLWRKSADLALAAGLIVLPLAAPVVASPLMTEWIQIQDRYTYLSTAGMCLLIALMLAKIPRASLAVAVILIAAGAAGTWRQERVWQSSETTWRHALEITPQSQFASVSLARDLARDGRFDEAAQVCQQALTYHPGSEVLRSFIMRARQLETRSKRYWTAPISRTPR